MGAKTILAVDDEEHILELIQYNLCAAGYQVVTAETGEEAVGLLDNNKFDLVLLDLMLPGIDGIEVLKQIRSHSRYKKLPVILLTAKSDEISKVVGLEVGADDYLSKPFGIHELIARIKAVLRRSNDFFEEKKEETEETVTVNELVINKTRRTVVMSGEAVILSRKEFDLLYFLAKNKGIVFSRDLLLEKIWGYDFIGETRTVDVHIRNLRKKIEVDDNHPICIKTIRGVGYKMDS